MNPTIKRYLVSSLTTFLASFFLTLSVQFKAGITDFTVAAVFAVISVAARAGVKAVVEMFPALNPSTN